MPTQWVIEVRLGTRPDAKPIRRAVVEAADEVEALGQVQDQAKRDLARSQGGLVDDGQEEVFAAAEARDGAEHHAGEEGGC